MSELFGVRDAAEYKAKQADFLRRNRRGVQPSATDAKPTVLDEPDAYRIKCSCGDYPTVDPDAKIACCFNCGLIYDGLELPKGDA